MVIKNYILLYYKICTVSCLFSQLERVVTGNMGRGGNDMQPKIQANLEPGTLWLLFVIGDSSLKCQGKATTNILE